MKKRTLKKLTLNKETIAHLDVSKMGNVYGGFTPPPPTATCESICLDKCPLPEPGGTGASCLMTVITGCE
jgi:natural product precursor